MKSSKLVLACAIALLVSPTWVGAEDATPGAEQTTNAPATGSEASSSPDAEAAGAAKPASHTVALGPVGHDEAGRAGRLHKVMRGDTLWDISDAYLGTPWVWPSIWTDNEAIENPHRIYPDDMIWITPHEMRKVSEAEAARLLAGNNAPAALSDGMADEKPQVYRYTEIQSTGFVGAEAYKGAAAIVDAPIPRKWLGDHDKVVIGLGEGETQVGAQYDVFRNAERVSDTETGILFGYHTEFLGWLEVVEVHPESSWAIIRLSRHEMKRGDEIVARRARSADIEVLAKPEVQGRVVFTPSRRFDMASTDVVYLDKGGQDGLSVGSPLEIFRTAERTEDAAKGEIVSLPDAIVAKLVVVDVTDVSAVAVVTHTVTELARGDRFRGSEHVRP